MSGGWSQALLGDVQRQDTGQWVPAGTHEVPLKYETKLFHGKGDRAPSAWILGIEVSLLTTQGQYNA